MTQDKYMSRGRVHTQVAELLDRMVRDPDGQRDEKPCASPRASEYVFRTLQRYDSHTKAVRMVQSRSTPMPPELAQAPMRTIRPRDADGTYAHPRAQLVRLSDRELLRRVADGYYVVVPQDMVGRTWTPGLEATAAGIASAIYGPDDIVVMGPSASKPGWGRRW
jgi:hypothetical protein